MPWKNNAANSPYSEFIATVGGGDASFSEACRMHGISRPTGYKWWRRFLRHGLEGLREQSRRPHRLSRAIAKEIRVAVERIRLERPSWGAKKIVWALRRLWPRRRLPHPRTLERWLPPRRGKARRISLWTTAPLFTAPRRRHDVWTMDFKGWFRTADGRRCEPLTVREARTCYLLYAKHAAAQSETVVRRALAGLFKREGLPRAIHVDNGAPFGGTGALGLTRLSVWWLQLGIQVRFSRPARPGDNAAHEQMHRVLKAEAATPPAATLAAQNLRLENWRHHYNHQRPHEALGQTPPAARYRPSPRRLPARLPAWSYPSSAITRRVSAGGWIWWRGRRRLIGRAFAGHTVALVARTNHHLIRIGPHLLGQLHPDDKGGIRPLRLSNRTLQSGRGEELRPSPSPPPSF